MKVVCIHDWGGRGVAITARLRTLARAHGLQLRFTRQRTDDSAAGMALDLIAGGLRTLEHLQARRERGGR